MRYFILILALLAVPLVSAKSFTFLYPTPPNNSTVTTQDIFINLSIYQDYPSEKCTLVLIENNNITREIQMNVDRHSCFKGVDLLKNNSNYTFYIITEDIKKNIEPTHNITFKVSLQDLDCELELNNKLRGCIINKLESFWPGNSLQRFLLAVLILAVIFIIMDNFNINPLRRR